MIAFGPDRYTPCRLGAGVQEHSNQVVNIAEATAMCWVFRTVYPRRMR